jgi:hypothetical protein
MLGGLLVASSGGIHLYLWDVAYRHVATLGPLFLLQFITGVILAMALVVLRRGWVMAATLALMAGTLGGFLLALTVGLFGFTLEFVTGWATLSVVIEGTAVVVLVAAGSLLWRQTP